MHNLTSIFHESFENAMILLQNIMTVLKNAMIYCKTNIYIYIYNIRKRTKIIQKSIDKKQNKNYKKLKFICQLKTKDGHSAYYLMKV